LAISPRLTTRPDLRHLQRCHGCREALRDAQPEPIDTQTAGEVEVAGDRAAEAQIGIGLQLQSVELQWACLAGTEFEVNGAPRLAPAQATAELEASRTGTRADPRQCEALVRETDLAIDLGEGQAEQAILPGTVAESEAAIELWLVELAADVEIQPELAVQGSTTGGELGIQQAGVERPL